METIDTYLKNLTGKDEYKAKEAAKYLIENSDIDLFRLLVEKTDYLFDFVRNNVEKRINKAINKNNYRNVLNFFSIYSSYYDDLFADILAEHANEDLTDEIFELLNNGNIAQKTYAAKYFYYIPDTIAIELLTKYAFSEDENLSFNSAEALGVMQDDISYDIALGMLQSEDDFEKLAAVKFFCAYGQNYPIDEIFKAMNSSKMPENIAGQIPYMVSLLNLIETDSTKENALLACDYIISGLGEILPLSDIFQMELYDIVQKLININNTDNNYSGLISVLLLKMYSKFVLFTENEEYSFDETKEVKNEIQTIYNLLAKLSKEFWDLQKEYILSELNKNNKRIIMALFVIREFSIVKSVDAIKNIIENSEDEVVLCEALTTLNSLKCLKQEDISIVMTKIHNPNVKAIIDNLI